MEKSKAFAGGGAWLIAAAFQVIPTTWPNLLSPHLYAVTGFLVLGAGMFAYAALGGKRSAPAINIDNKPSNEANPTFSPVFAPVFNNNVPVLPVNDMITAPGAPIAANDPPKRPTVTIGPIEQRDTCHQALDVFRFDEVRGSAGAIVWITNEPSSCGPMIAAVSLTFRSGAAIAEHVNRAFWIGHTGYQLHMEVSTREAVLLGYCHDGKLLVFTNSRKHNLQTPRRWSQQRRLLEAPRKKPKYLDFETPIEVEISVVNALRGGELEAMASFILTPAGSAAQLFTWERTK